MAEPNDGVSCTIKESKETWLRIDRQENRRVILNGIIAGNILRFSGVGEFMVSSPNRPDEMPSVNDKMPPKLSTGKTGKLSGIQLQQIHANDQLQELLKNRFDKLLTKMAMMDTESFAEYLRETEGFEDGEAVIYQAVHAAILFTTVEIHERGLGSEELDSEEPG